MPEDLTPNQQSFLTSMGRKGAFLAALQVNGNVTAAARAADIDRAYLYRARRANAEFAAQWDEALEIAWDRLEAEAFRRAVDGWEEPIFQNGLQVGTKKLYSDRLLEIMLRAKRKKEFADKPDPSAIAVVSVADLVRLVDGATYAPTPLPDAPADATVTDAKPEPNGHDGA